MNAHHKRESWLQTALKDKDQQQTTVCRQQLLGPVEQNIGATVNRERLFGNNMWWCLPYVGPFRSHV
jgi:hypothetical protein